jgi:hypothetical protein
VSYTDATGSFWTCPWRERADEVSCHRQPHKGGNRGGGDSVPVAELDTAGGGGAQTKGQGLL